MPKEVSHDLRNRPEPNVDSRPRPSRANWPLWAGGAIALFILLIALVGPALAPRDPMEENTIIRVGEAWEIPPFRAFSVPGFPLGSDQFGRDLLSRLLWGVRPTMVMVVIVAAVRLILGVVIGMGAGWSTGQVGRVLDGAIGMALSVPVLMVALGAIALLGVELGLLTFIVGLSINGWVDTARLVREQTRIIKEALYVEAARALGASGRSILWGHVLRQIMPMLWMLFAFEVGNTLMTTAGLGFLGYYIGGDVWVDVSDFVARRLSGMPELGQMLSSAWNEQQIITEPWGMIVAGSVIFIAVLGFNLLGEGLRLRLRLDRLRRRGVVQRMRDVFASALKRRVGAWTPERKLLPDRLSLRLAVAGLALLFVGGGLVWWRFRSAEPVGEAWVPTSAPVAPDEPLWSGARHDAQGTLWSPFLGPAAPQIRWTWQDATGFSGGPAIAVDGTLYLSSGGGTLSALDAQGNILWQSSLPAGGVGTPALNAGGQIFVTDEAGNLSVFDPGGALVWRLEGPDRASTGPIVAADGTVYFAGGNQVHAVSLGGELLWSARAPFGFEPAPPHLDPSETLVFFLEAVFDARDGSPQELEALADQAGNQQHITGADGQLYYRSERKILQWRPTPSGSEVIRVFNKQIPGIPKEAGVTRDGVVWAAFKLGLSNPSSGIVWLDLNDQGLGNVEYPHISSQVIAVDSEATVYACGTLRDDSLQCIAARPGLEEPLWEIPLEQESKVVGGALAPRMLYVATAGGIIYAIGPTVEAE